MNEGMNEKYNNMIVVHSMNYFSLFVFITFQIYITASDFFDFPCSFQCTKKTFLYLREDERMEEFRFIDNGIHFFLCDQSSWLDMFVCLATMNIITLLKQNDIYETISMMICFAGKEWKKNQK